MRRFVSSLTAAFAAAVLFAIAVSIGSGQQPAHATRPESTIDALSSQELIAAFDEANASSPDRAMQIFNRLRERRKEIPQHDLVSTITDTNRSRATRELMIDLLAGPPEEAQVTEDARGLLRDDHLDPALKARVLASYDFGPEDSGLLSSLASGPEDAVAFHALKKLGSADPSAARRLALTTLARGEWFSDSKLSASYKVLIRSGAIQSDPEVRNTLLGHLASVLDDARTSPRLKDSAAFALSDMRSLEALRMLLESKGADRILCVGAVDQNAMLIKTALERNPDEATIELAVTAMELYPVKEIASPLRAACDRVTSPALSQRMDAVLERIAREGVPLNIKWTED